ncbi:hypothetical protein NC651_015510 [Populus alba x Populus x berolinensis]|nr:hypothetical protein NC651_015510 [Populus alba x Populus x berolinensis]
MQPRMTCRHFLLTSEPGKASIWHAGRRVVLGYIWFSSSHVKLQTYKWKMQKQASHVCTYIKRHVWYFILHMLLLHLLHPFNNLYIWDFVICFSLFISR